METDWLYGVRVYVTVCLGSCLPVGVYSLGTFCLPHTHCLPGHIHGHNLPTSHYLPGHIHGHSLPASHCLSGHIHRHSLPTLTLSALAQFHGTAKLCG